MNNLSGDKFPVNNHFNVKENHQYDQFVSVLELVGSMWGLLFGLWVLVADYGEITNTHVSEVTKTHHSGAEENQVM